MTHKVLIMGAAGRDFHMFNCCYRDDNDTDVVAFTATQIPHIEDRVYPASLAGPRYPEGIPIHPEEQLGELVSEYTYAAIFRLGGVVADPVFAAANLRAAKGHN